MHRHYRHRIWIIVVGLILLISLAFLTNFGKDSSKTDIHLGSMNIKVDVADTEELRAKGLSGRLTLGDRQGMLFVFEKPGIYKFWMKDMKFPIDIAWINEAGQVVFVENNISPETYPTSFGSYAPAKYVLEVNAGVMDASGVRTGEYVQFDEEFIKKL